MKPKGSPVRATIIYGAIGAAIIYTLSIVIPYPFASHVYSYGALLLIAGYGYLLAKWEGRTPGCLIFSLTLGLLATTLSPADNEMLIIPAQLLTLSWIRSDILHGKPGLRSLILEALLCFGGAFMATVLTTDTHGGAAIAIWIFFLAQSLYFPLHLSARETSPEILPDIFEQAGRRVERILLS